MLMFTCVKYPVNILIDSFSSFSCTKHWWTKSANKSKNSLNPPSICFIYLFWLQIHKIVDNENKVKRDFYKWNEVRYIRYDYKRYHNWL